MFSAILFVAIAFAIWAYFTVFKLLVMAVWWLVKAVFGLRRLRRVPRTKTLGYHLSRALFGFDLPNAVRKRERKRARQLEVSQKA